MIFKNITKVVWIISLVSLFNDFSSEMLYPIIPLYLQQIGYGGLALGILEGVSEFISGLSKIVLGRLSDLYNKRLPFVQLGYSLSVLSRPILGLTSNLAWVFGARSADRIGKGIRSAARDALLADESTSETKAEIFGFHRSMDTLGAVLGPALALIYLHYHPGNYKALFFITFLPGIVAILFTFLIKEKKHTASSSSTKSMWYWKSYFSFYKEAPKTYLLWLVVFIAFALVNSSDMFLLLRAKNLGFSETRVLQFYILFNLSFTLLAYPIGLITNKLGVINVFILGLVLYATAYILFSLNWPMGAPSSLIMMAFIIYGSFYSCTQGATKIILLKHVDPSVKASAIGLYEGLNSFGLFLANFIAGLVWMHFGASVLFSVVAFIVLLIAVVILFMRKNLS